MSSRNLDDIYNDNDEVDLASNNQIIGKSQLQQQVKDLKQQISEANLKIKDYEEIISKNNVKEFGDSNLSQDDLFNIIHNSTFIIATE